MLVYETPKFEISPVSDLAADRLFSGRDLGTDSKLLLYDPSGVLRPTTAPVPELSVASNPRRACAVNKAKQGRSIGQLSGGYSVGLQSPPPFLH